MLKLLFQESIEGSADEDSAVEKTITAENDKDEMDEAPLTGENEVSNNFT